MKAKLPDLCTIQYGFAFDSSFFTEDNRFLPLVRIRDVKRGFSETYYSGNYPEEYIIHPGDLLIGMDGEFNIARWQSRDALLNQRVCKISAKPGTDGEYLRLALVGALKQIEERTAFVTVKHLSAKELNKLVLDVPPYEKQVRIANTLATLEHIISQRNAQLSSLDTLVKARFVEMFDYKAFAQSQFGEICKFLRNGASIKQTKGAGGFPITRIETLSNNVLNVDRLGYADIFELDKYENYVLQKGDILISHINSVAYLGRAVQYRGELSTPIIHGMNLLCARILETLNPTYVEYFFRTPMARDYIATITKKAVNQASMTTTDLKKMPIPVPPLSLQNHFAAFAAQVERTKATIRASLTETQRLFGSLMQEFF